MNRELTSGAGRSAKALIPYTNNLIEIPDGHGLDEHVTDFISQPCLGPPGEVVVVVAATCPLSE